MEEDRKVVCIYVPLLDILLYLPIFRRSDGFCLVFGTTYRLSYRKLIVGAFLKFFREACFLCCAYIAKRMRLNVKNLKLFQKIFGG